MPKPIYLGQKLRRARKDAGLTQDELAKAVGVATVTIQQYERNLREPKYRVLYKISEVLGLPGPSYFLEPEDAERTPYPNVNAERARAGLTQEQLAAKLGVTRKTLYNWELTGIPKDKLDLMAEIFGVSPDYLLDQPGADTDEPAQEERPSILAEKEKQFIRSEMTFFLASKAGAIMLQREGLTPEEKLAVTEEIVREVMGYCRRVLGQSKRK